MGVSNGHVNMYNLSKVWSPIGGGGKIFRRERSQPCAQMVNDPCRSREPPNADLSARQTSSSAPPLPVAGVRPRAPTKIRSTQAICATFLTIIRI